MNARKTTVLTALLVAATALPTAPAGLPSFVTGINNPYFPCIPGRTLHYLGETDEGTETTDTATTSNTKVILGVTCMEIHDQVSLEGSLIEDTLDWFAQDTAGNVWYFGEDSKQYENGVLIGTEGSWEAGVDGAMPGIVMLAKPLVGKAYQQEFAPGIAMDRARVIGVKKSVSVPYGSFHKNCLRTLDFTPLDLGNYEHKSYAPGIGLILEFAPSSGERNELVSVTGP